MITVKKEVSTVIKESTILSAYVVSGVMGIMPGMVEQLTEDLRALNELEESELVTSAKTLVTLAIMYNQTPNPHTLKEAQQALSKMGDLFLQTKEVK